MTILYLAFKKFFPSHSDCARPLKLTQFVNNNVESDSFFTIPLITKELIYSEFEKLDINKSSGLDGLSPKILKFQLNIYVLLLKRL